MRIPLMHHGLRDDRSRILPVMLVVLASGGLAAAADTGQTPDTTRHRRETAVSELRGVWVSDVDSTVMESRKAMAALAAEVSQLNLNALYPVVWSQGETFYPSDVMVRHGGGPISGRYGLGDGKRDPMADWVSLGAAHDLDIVPWFEWGLKMRADAGLAKAHPDWLSRNQAGNVTFDQDGIQTVYLNFVHPEVQRFYEELVAEFVTRYDVPAIQFDDHLSLKNTFGYDDLTLALYREETGRTERPEPAADEWLAWRASKLTKLISRISAAVRRARPGTRLSIAPNPYPWSYRNYVQDWPSWVEAGLVDDVVVQVYRDNLERFAGELRSPVLEKLRGKARIGIGVLAGQKPAPVPIDRIRAQTEMVRDRGYAGVVYFFQESLLRFLPPDETSTARLDGIRRMFPTPARVPGPDAAPAPTTDAATDATTGIAAGLAAAGTGLDQQALAGQADAIAALPADRILPCLERLGTATPGGANWLRSGLDRAAESAGDALAAETLAAFVADTSRAARPRTLAYTWLEQRDPAAAARLLDGFLEDPALDLRRAAVDRLLASAAATDAAAQDRVHREALVVARDVDQIERIAGWLREHGTPVDLAAVLGFVRRWRLSDAFDNRGGVGFATAYPPELAAADLDTSAWKTLESTDAHGMVDLNAAIEKRKGVLAYAVAEVEFPDAWRAEVRIGSPCGIVAWVNGVRVMDHEIYHASEAIDQYVAAADFRAGRNVVMVKCCQNEQTESWAGDWQFQLRICDELGAPLGSQSE